MEQDKGASGRLIRAPGALQALAVKLVKALFQPPLRRWLLCVFRPRCWARPFLSLQTK
jgi:hypothetical protein